MRDDGRYRLSLRSVSVGEMALRQINLGDRVEPILERLVQETSETASITVMQAGQPVIIQPVEVDRAIVTRQKIGARLDLTTSASGKIHIIFNEAVLTRISPSFGSGIGSLTCRSVSGPEIWSASVVAVFGVVFFLVLIGDAGSSDQRAARGVKQKQLFGREPRHHPLRGRTGLRLEARQGFLTADPEEGELVRSGGLDDVDRHLDHVILGSAETLFLLDRLGPDAD